MTRRSGSGTRKTGECLGTILDAGARSLSGPALLAAAGLAGGEEEARPARFRAWLVGVETVIEALPGGLPVAFLPESDWRARGVAPGSSGRLLAFGTRGGQLAIHEIRGEPGAGE